MYLTDLWQSLGDEDSYEEDLEIGGIGGARRAEALTRRRRWWRRGVQQRTGQGGRSHS